MKALSLFVLFATSVSFASPNDVHGKGDYYIKVVRTADQNAVSFELCPVLPNTACKALGLPDSHGKPRFYRLADLRDRRSAERWQFLGSLFADVTIGVVLVYGGAATAAVISTAASLTGPSMGALAAGTATGAATTAAIAHFISPLNSVDQYRQRRMIGEDVLADGDVKFNAPILKMADALNTVLKKLTPTQ